jgi:diguanylate cyclase (GGDEF)-like protein
MSSQLVSIFAGFGSYLNSHFYFVLFAILPVAFFPIKQWLSIILLFVVNFALYLAFEYHGMAPSAEVFALSDTTVRVLRASYATTTVLTMFVLIWLFEMVSEKNERELESVSHTDPLTKLPNRRLFEQVLRQEMAKSRRNQQPLVIAMLDIDRFKLINDTYGHGVGDDVLKHLSLHLRNTTRTGNVIARVGGEEFALLLPHTSVPEALEVVERLRRVVQDNGFPLKGQMLTITVSIGVAMVDCDMPPERSTQLADEALYTAKRAGRNRVVAHGTPD